MNVSNFLNQFFESDGKLIAFGETYHGTHDAVISEIAHYLTGFSKVLLEKPISMQPDIDEYLGTGRVSERLESHFQNAAKEGKNIRTTLLAILDSAKQNSLPVFCVDSSKVKTEEYSNESLVGRYFLRGASRDEDMFTNIQKLIEENDKGIFFGGFQHLMNGIHFRSGELTLGSRLHEKYGDKFYSCAMYKLKDEDRNIIDNKIEMFDLKSKEASVAFDLFVKKSGVQIKDETGKLYFDGYILHT